MFGRRIHTLIESISNEDAIVLGQHDATEVILVRKLVNQIFLTYFP